MFLVVVCQVLGWYFDDYQECKVRPQIVNLNQSPICKNVCFYVSDVVKNLNIKMFNLMSRTNETRYIEWHETCKCKCKLDESVCNNKQHWNDDKSRCEWKEFIDRGVCVDGFIWNPSNCECECDKSCDVGEYLDYENCKWRKKLVDKLKNILKILMK